MRKVNIQLTVLCVMFGVSMAMEEMNLTKYVDDFINDIGADEEAKNHHHHHNNHGEHEGHVMKMWFHGGVNEVILFDWWTTDSVLAMVLSCCAIYIMAATYEGVKWFRMYLLSQANSTVIANRTCVEFALQTAGYGKNANVGSQNTTRSGSKAMNANQSEPFMSLPTIRSLSAFSTQRILEAFLYMGQLVLAYWLMLIVMTYNTYLTISVVAGAGFGHWLFAVLQLRSVDIEATDSFQTDACH